LPAFFAPLALIAAQALISTGPIVSQALIEQAVRVTRTTAAVRQIPAVMRACRILVTQPADVAQGALAPWAGTVAKLARIARARVIAPAPGQVGTDPTILAGVRKISAPAAAVAPLADWLETSPAA
jgi:hypothetical protein